MVISSNSENTQEIESEKRFDQFLKIDKSKKPEFSKEEFFKSLEFQL